MASVSTAGGVNREPPFTPERGHPFLPIALRNVERWVVEGKVGGRVVPRSAALVVPVDVLRRRYVNPSVELVMDVDDVA